MSLLIKFNKGSPILGNFQHFILKLFIQNHTLMKQFFHITGVPQHLLSLKKTYPLRHIDFNTQNLLLYRVLLVNSSRNSSKTVSNSQGKVTLGNSH
jgi:hypothetical protein